MKFKIGSYYKITDKDDPTDWDISYVTNIDLNTVTFVVVKRSVNCYVENDYMVSSSEIENNLVIVPVGHYTSKLGKILYGSK